MAVVNGIAYWASVQKPNTKFEPVWSVDLEVSPEDGEKLDSLGIPKNKDGRYKFKRKVKGKNGDNSPPVVVDSNGTPFSDLIGNGSEVMVQYKKYNWEFSGKKGVGADLQALMVKELVPYGEGGLEFKFNKPDTEFESDEETPF